MAFADLGNGQYRYTFTITNNGAAYDALSKRQTDSGSTPSEWQTVSFTVPTGWSAKHSDHHLDFQTDNGSLKGPDRLYGRAGVCGSGHNSGVFVWTFTNNGGPTPSPYSITLDQMLFHVQPIASDCTNAGSSYTVRYGPTPVLPLSWGAVKAIYR
jgi:hypothetical protein